VYVVEPRVFGDERGFFFESYHAARFREAGIAVEFVQDNHSQSVRGTLRGLHYQLAHPQSKLCRVVRGEVLDVAVDIRRGSPTFGQWTTVLLSEENQREIFVPAGFAHGFLVLSERADFLYKCGAYYYPDDQYGIAWDDPQIGVEWGSVADPILSDKDRRLPRLADVPQEHLPPYQR